MPVAQQTAVTTKPPTEAHLRLILESQPVCLTRVGAPDGTFLAVNDAALSMLGAERLDQVLGTCFFDLLDESQRTACREFLTRIAGGERGSFEADLTSLSGSRHNMQIHAVPHPQPVDGLPSALCTFRDLTEHRRLEAVVVENAGRGADEGQLQRLQELEATLAEHQAAREELVAAVAARETELAEVERARAEAVALAQELTEESEAQRTRLAEIEEFREHAEARARELAEQTAARQELEATRQQLETSLGQHQARTAEL
jgi:hypothetical protein